jgi:hypothetical protein
VGSGISPTSPVEPARAAAGRDAGRARALAIVPRHARWLDGHLARLRALPAHGNRVLRADQLFLGLLLASFDPLARSLRLVEDAADFGGRLDLPRLARSTTADALAAFDPACLRPVIDDLRARVPDLAHGDAGLAGITRRIVAADGTYITTLADVAWALRHAKRDGRSQGQVRANVQLDVATWAPQVVTVSGDDGESEPAAVGRDLLGGVLYVVDRNFLDFAFLGRVVAAGSDFVLRVRANAPAARVVRARAVTADDAAAGVVADEVVELTGRGAPAGRFRRVTLVTADRTGAPTTIRLLTSLVADDVAARVVGAVYRQRWQVELFFKWLKAWARMGHLLSTSRNGITFQLYVAVIAVLLMHLRTGRRVSVYALAALGRLARGELTPDQAIAAIARRHREADLNAARQARRRARKKLA